MRSIVYRFYDAKGRLLYVGLTSRGMTRWMEHADSQPWWAEVAAIRVVHFPTREDGEVEEARAIRDERPLHNTIRYDGKPQCRGIYREHGTGTIYQRGNNGAWIASLHIDGKRLSFYAGKDRARAEEWLAGQLQEAA